MPRQHHQGEYPENWPQIAEWVKEQNGWKCERCGHPHDPDSGHTLTVHHLDCDKSNCEDWNLAALCQVCHLHIQGKVFLAQFYMFEHSDWFVPHIVGYYGSIGIKWTYVDLSRNRSGVSK